MIFEDLEDLQDFEDFEDFDDFCNFPRILPKVPSKNQKKLIFGKKLVFSRFSLNLLKLVAEVLEIHRF